MKLSLIVPCYNEGMNVIPFRDAVISAFQNCGFDYEIIFIDDGRVLAVGTHSELSESCPEYKTMVDLQKLEEERGE